VVHLFNICFIGNHLLWSGSSIFNKISQVL